MPDRRIIPGRVKPARFQYARSTAGASQEWRWTQKKRQPAEDQPGTLICPRCHAISELKRWYFDERRYRQLKFQPGVGVVTCPGCTLLDRGMYGGEVHLRSPLLARNKLQALGIIRHQEEEAALENPLARLAIVQDNGEEITVITTTPFLAERIGQEFRKAFDGRLRIDRLPWEKFSRVYWERA